MKLKHAVVFATALSLAPFTAFAAKKAAAAPKAAPKAVVPTLDAVLGASGINVSGAVDVSYDWTENSQSAGHSFDVDNSSFVLHQINLTISKQWSNGLSLVVNPILGEDASFLNGTGTRGTTSLALAQAYLSYNFGDLTLSGGRMLTLAGAEVINPAGNINASRGLLFGLQPLIHTGVRGTYALCKNLTATLGVVNGGASGTINNINNNNDVSVESQLAYSSGSFTVAYTNYYGVEDTAARANGVQTNVLHDVVISVTPIDALTLGLNADFFTGEAATGAAQTDNFGVAAYSNFKLTPKARFAVRGEYLSLDKPAANTGYDYLNSLTGTFGYSPLSGLELIAEYRTDNSADGSGVNTLGFPTGSTVFGHNGSAGTGTFQNSGTLKAIYKF